ncbi:ABC transporter ATP-binding protein [Denitrobaculum tricleocarpae]|uniref:Glutathione import ATP-binding protein GsiA n=2 Tax=Denitrobaculum tricleocarpae TaxID=2591009 RepID=A0A545TYS8_9PROT|nr:ABC transporter ATP-binding protein [Denitrobaculum tricleocarpae]
MIDIQDLSVVFGSSADRVHAVKNVSCQIAVGESFGLVGESGSGKSTVLRALCGLATGWEGGITIDGEALEPSARRSNAFYKTVQMVFQDPYGSLHPRHTVNRILSEPIAIQGLDKPGSRVDEALEQVGLGQGFRFRFPHQLSGGQRQRVAIARALILKPKILLLDEPTSALDVSVQAEVLNLLMRLREELSLTFVLVSHDLAVVSHICDRIAVMRNGEVVEEITADDLARGQPAERYTRQLLVASKGYDRAAIDQFEDFG